VIRKKPEPDLVIRLVGKGVNPWAVPTASLSRTLQAVQRLMEQSLGEEHAARPLNETDSKSEEHESSPMGGDGDLFLLDVKCRSATYLVVAEDPERTRQVLRHTDEVIKDPQNTNWSADMLPPVKILSDVARHLRCRIEFRQPGKGRQMGDVIATIGPSTDRQLADTAFVCGETSIYAKIERIGGAKRIGCALRVPNQSRKLVYCSLSDEKLARELGRYLYQYVVVNGRAKWFKRDWKLLSMNIDSFEPPKGGSIVKSLERIHEAGGYAWDRVTDPEKLLSEWRG